MSTEANVAAARDEEVLRLTAERDEARDWVRRLTATDRVLTCVYCGSAYPPGSPEHGAAVLTAHVRVCEKHPMREVEAKLARILVVAQSGWATARALAIQYRARASERAADAALRDIEAMR